MILAGIEPKAEMVHWMFATGILVGFPQDDRDTVEFVNFGHEPPLVVAPDGVRDLPPGHGLPLGLAALTAERPLVLTVALAPGETLLLVTDGVTEARDADGVFFPLRDRVAGALSADPSTADPQRLDPLLALHERDRANGLLDAPWPPVYPKQPDEPPRVAPSRARRLE